MKIKEKISETLTNVSRLDEMERKHRIMLPEDYRLFLITTNGGRPVERRFSFIEHGKQTNGAIGWFFGDCDDADYGISSNWKTYNDRIPPAFFPIATDAFGNLILLSCRDEDRGAIYFWDHEKESDVPSMTNMFRVANSFSEFVEHLV
jgi:hypothetical protein